MRYFKTSMIGIICLVIGMLMVSATGVLAQPRVTLRFTLNPNVYLSIPQSPSVNISVDRGEGGTYNIGDPITIRYSTTGPGYINIVDYTPDGGAQILVRDQRVAGGTGLIYNYTVSGPTGVERLVILLTPKPIGESQIQNFIQEPHQSDRTFPRSAVNRTHFNVVARTRSSSLNLQPPTFAIEPGANRTLTAELIDPSGRPLPGRILNWLVDDGSLNTYNTTTDSGGRSSVVFYAPGAGPTTVNISVSFPGERGISPSSAQSVASIASRIRSTQLSVNPSSFTAKPGDEVQLTAFLRDSNGSPLANRTIYWNATEGNLNRASTVTNSSGKAPNTFYAPNVDTSTTVTVGLEFRGSSGYEPASQNVDGSIEPEAAPNPPNATLYFLELGTGTAEHNFSSARYSGNLTPGFSLSGTSSLEMMAGDSIDLAFNPGTVPEKAALFLWVQGDSGSRIRIVLNNQRVSTLTPGTGMIQPDTQKILVLPVNSLVSGNNRLRIEVDAGRNITVHIQRLLLVF